MAPLADFMSSSSTTKLLKSRPTFGETPYRQLPNFYGTTIQLSTLLDIEQPLGHDYRAVLELLGFPPEDVRFWGCKCTRPTLEALKEWDGTVQKLAEALQECERYDALSVLVQALVEILQQPHKLAGDTSGTNILTREAFSAPRVPLPTLRLADADTRSQARTQEFKQSSGITIHQTTQSTAPFTPSTDSIDTTSLCDDSSTHDVCLEEIGARRLPSEATVATWMVESKPNLDTLLRSPFEVPVQLATTYLSSSNGRKIPEFLCNVVAYAVRRYKCMSNSGDLTWITNTSVYINNCARAFLILLASISVATCVFGSHHTPSYVMEFILSAVPVVQSLYVEQNLPTYRDFIKKIKEVEASMGLITKTLEQRPGKSLTNDTNILKELDVRKAKVEKLKARVLPVYSDIRLCIISTLAVEIVLIIGVLCSGLLYFTGEEVLEKFRDGFTSLALALVCIDCVYNFALVAVYYHDRTIETVLRKDRFRLNALLSDQESDVV